LLWEFLKEWEGEENQGVLRDAINRQVVRGRELIHAREEQKYIALREREDAEREANEDYF
jgi:hypothetical protein